VADGVAECGALLTGVVLPGVVAAGAVLAAGEPLAPLGAVLLAGAVAAAPDVLADGVGDGLAGAGLPSDPPPRVVPWPGLPWTTADSGLPAAPSSKVTTMAQPINAATMNAAGPAQRRCERPFRPGTAAVDEVTTAAWLTTASSPGCSGRPRARMASARALASAADRRMPRSAHQEAVPEARLPITIPTIVPAAPIRLPRIAASMVPVVAATMAGRCERKVSGLACGCDSGLAVSLVMISVQVMAHRRAERCKENQATRRGRSGEREERHPPLVCRQAGG